MYIRNDNQSDRFSDRFMSIVHDSRKQFLAVRAVVARVMYVLTARRSTTKYTLRPVSQSTKQDNTRRERS